MSDLNAYDDLHARIVAWAQTLDVASAAPLLSELRALPLLKGKATPAVALMRKLQTVAEVKASDERYDASQVPILQLVATDPSVGWPWCLPVQPSSPAADSGGDAECRRRLVKSLYGMSAEQSRDRSRGLAHLAAIVACLPTPAGRAALCWLESAFRLRLREMWVPAALAQAGLVAANVAGGGPVALLRERLEASAVPLLAPKRKSAGEDHLRRHVRVAAILAALFSGSFAGGDADAWLESASADYHTLTAVAVALLELAEEHPDLAARGYALVAQALDRIRAKFPKEVTYQAWEVARALIDAVGSGEPSHAAWTLLLDLSAPHAARTASLSAGDLYDAGATLRWMRARGDDVGLIQRLRAGRLAGQPGVAAAAIGEFSSWGDRVAYAFRTLAPHRRDGLPRSESLGALVELCWLVDWPDAADLVWAHVVRGADAAWFKASDGSVDAVAWADIFAIACDLDALFAQALHQRPIDASQDHGARPTTGLERLLRTRWLKRTAVNGLTSTWKVHPHLSDQAGNHVVARLVSSEDDAAVARILLSVLSADSPPDDARSALSGVEKDKFWDYVLKWWPDFDGKLAPAGTHPLLDPLVRWESERSSSDIHEVLRRGEVLFRDLSVALPTLQPVCAPISRVATLLEAAWLERPQGTGTTRWRVGPVSASSPEANVASPSAMRSWCDQRVVGLARAIAEASSAIVAITGEPFAPDLQLEKVLRVRQESAHEVEMPLVDEDTAAEWRSALHALRTLAAPLPWHVEGAVDALAGAVEEWIVAGEANRVRRKQLVEDLQTAMSDGSEAEVLRLAFEERLLLGKAEIGRVGRYFLRRLRLTEAKRVRAFCDEVPQAWQYFAPLLLGVAGAPLSSIQTNMIWEPLLVDAHAGDYTKYAFVVAPMFLISLYLLYSDVKVRAPDLDFKQILRRGGLPLLLLLLVNYGGNWVVWWSVSRDVALEAGWLVTSVMWGTLSLFLGIFLGLIAQGRGMAED